MQRRLSILALVAAAACGPTERPQVTLGDPVENLVTVEFASDVQGDGLLIWEYNGREFRRDLGESEAGGWRTTIWVPSGRSTKIRGAVRKRSGDLEEGPSKRVRLPKPPRNMRWKLNVNEPGSQIGDGVLLLNAYQDNESYAFVLNQDADVLWWTGTDTPTDRFLRLRPGLDNRSIVASTWAVNHKAVDDGWIVRFDLDSGQGRIDTRALEFHHDFVELPGERFAWLSWSHDTDRFVSGIGSVPVASDAIRIADEGAREGDETVLFDLLEDYPSEVYYSCGHMSPGGFAGPDWWEWSHSNSLVYDEQTDSLRFLARYWDSVVQVGLDGELDWTMGGRDSEFDTQGWFHHAHASELTGSSWVLFDNGNHADPEVTRIVGLEVDFDAGVVQESFSIPDPERQFTTYLGDVRRLPGGNLLVLWSPEGLIQEFTPAGKIVWEAEIDSSLVVARLTWTDELVPR